MTSSVNKSSSLYSEPYLYEDISNIYKREKSVPIPDIAALNKSLNYGSHVDRLFQKNTINQTYVDPPSITPGIENRLFLSDLIGPYENLVSYWHSSLKKLDNLSQYSSTSKMRKLLEYMEHLSQISRDISNKRYEFQKS
ncbi:MAG: hypothetical protein ACRCSV_03315 [Chlamydiales bacterium]